MQRARHPYLDLVPSNKSLALFPQEAAGHRGEENYCLRDALERMPSYDFILFDAPPSFGTITRVKPGAEARVLAWFRGGEPALLERAKGRGKILWFTSACDRAWGDWPRGRMFLPMVHQMVAYASGLAEGGPVRAELSGFGRPPGLFESDGLVRVVNPDPS